MTIGAICKCEVATVQHNASVLKELTILTNKLMAHEQKNESTKPN